MSPTFISPIETLNVKVNHEVKIQHSSVLPKFISATKFLFSYFIQLLTIDLNVFLPAHKSPNTT